ncbi:MAG: prephenate dehydrogenase [Bacteroidia bacterium]|nr:prephenate dehydrogenase [Bacteroidia bacterium]
MKIAVIGLGLIGGSLAKDLKERGFATYITGNDVDEKNAQDALELGIVDTISTMELAVKGAELVLVTVPVSAITALLPQILNNIDSQTVVVDFGSTKEQICQAVKTHPKRQQYVAAHPIAGTEKSGPAAAVNNLFDNKTTIICEKELSAAKALQVAEVLFKTLNMNLMYMEAREHDVHLAYVSHLPHVISFAMVNTVLEAEKDSQFLFRLAGSGFASLTRLAKSSPDMWAPIFTQNASHVSEAIDLYIAELELFKRLVNKKDATMLHRMLERSNEVKNVTDASRS